jgi:hypothetical protein
MGLICQKITKFDQKFGMTFANFFDIGALFLDRNGCESTFREKWAAQVKSLQTFHTKKAHKSAFAPQQHQKLHLHHSSTKKAHKSAFAPQQHQKAAFPQESIKQPRSYTFNI